MWRELIIIVSLATIVPRIMDLVISLGFHKTLYDHSPGKCQLLPRIGQGSEDIQVTSKGIAIISSGLKFYSFLSPTSPINKFKGAIFSLDLNQSKSIPRKIKMIGDPTEELFNPHGISIWESTSGDVFVYLINHLPDKELVDKYLFDEEANTLTLTRRIEGDANFHQTNDLVVVGDNDEFYLSNCFYTKHGILELLLQFHFGSVVYYDGKTSRIVADKMFGPNGIRVSEDNKYLYLAEHGTKNFLIFHRNQDNGLTLASKTPLYTGIDNLDIDRETGDIWIGSCPVGYKISQHLENPASNPAPSQVLKLKVNGDKVESVEEIFMDATGETISAASVAVKYKNKLLIGTVVHKALICDLYV